MLRVFIGYDSREPVAYHVAAHSVMRHASRPVAITPLIQPQLRTAGLYTREQDQLAATEFSLTRFLVPYLSEYGGVSIFMDCDMLCQADVYTLLMYPLAYAKCGVFVCQHDYVPKQSMKMDGQKQTTYPKKNWSSFMVFNNELCGALTPKFVNGATPAELHRFEWPGIEVGSLPLHWNWLVGEYDKNPGAHILHYTNGGPWFAGYEHCDHADLWKAERDLMLTGVYSRCL